MIDDKTIQMIAEKLAAANFADDLFKPGRQITTDKMFAITEVFGLNGDISDDDNVVALFHALDAAAGIDGLQSNTLGELAEMIRKDLRERRGIEVTPLIESTYRRDAPTLQ
jgi:hypothetical protein